MFDLDVIKEEWKKIATGIILIVALCLCIYFYNVYDKMEQHLNVNMNDNASETIHNEYKDMPDEFKNIRKK